MRKRYGDRGRHPPCPPNRYRPGGTADALYTTPVAPKGYALKTDGWSLSGGNMSLDVYLEIEVDTGGKEKTVINLYESNITHNLNEMAMEAGIYHAFWRPEEIDGVYAEDIIPVLEGGLKMLEKDPKKYKKFNPENGWGDYEGLIGFAQKYLDACRQHPKAKIRTSR